VTVTDVTLTIVFRALTVVQNVGLCDEHLRLAKEKIPTAEFQAANRAHCGYQEFKEPVYGEQYEGRCCICQELHCRKCSDRHLLCVACDQFYEPKRRLVRRTSNAEGATDVAG